MREVTGEEEEDILTTADKQGLMLRRRKRRTGRRQRGHGQLDSKPLMILILKYAVLTNYYFYLRGCALFVTYWQV